MLLAEVELTDQWSVIILFCFFKIQANKLQD